MSHLSSSCISMRVLALSLCCGLVTAACVIDTTSSQDLECEQEGAVEGTRQCVGGIWVPSMTPDMMMDTGRLDQGEPLDMSPIDQAVDMPGLDMPGLDMPGGDLGIDMAVPPDMLIVPDEGGDMACSGAQKQAECTRLDVCDTTTDPMASACGEHACDARCASGTCLDNRCEVCPSTAEGYCAIMSKVRTSQVCGTWTTASLEGCPLPATPLVCKCEAPEVCTLSGGVQQGVCGVCTPITDDVLTGSVPNLSCGVLMADDGCGMMVQVKPPVESCLPYETCADSSTMFDGQVVKVCQPRAPQLLMLPQPAPSSDAEFGYTIVVEGELLAIGARSDSNGTPGAKTCGTVYVYERNVSLNTWEYQDQLVISDTSICNSGNEEFGTSIAILDRLIAVGAPGDGESGRIFYFEDQSNTKQWRYVVGLDGNSFGAVKDAEYGYSLSMMYDQTPTMIGPGSLYTIVGAPRDSRSGPSQEGITYLHITQDNTSGGADAFNTFIFDPPGDTKDSYYGEAVLFRDRMGTMPRLVTGQPDHQEGGKKSGAIYTSGIANTGTRQSLRTINAGIGPDDDDDFGSSLASSGSWVAVSAPEYELSVGNNAGIVALLSDTMPMTLNTFVQASNASGGDRFGSAVALSYPWLLVGADREDGEGDAHDQTGAVYLYSHNGTLWQDTGYIWRAPNQPDTAHTGHSVALHPEWAFFGSPDDGAGKVYMVPLTP